MKLPLVVGWSLGQERTLADDPSEVGSNLNRRRHPDSGGECTAAIYSLVETAKHSGLDPQACLREVRLWKIALQPEAQQPTACAMAT